MSLVCIFKNSSELVRLTLVKIEMHIFGGGDSTFPYQEVGKANLILKEWQPASFRCFRFSFILVMRLKLVWELKFS